MYQHQWVVIDIDDAAVRRDGLGDLMSVLGCGQAGADVEELADAALGGQEPYGPGKERPVGPCSRHYLRTMGDDFLSDHTVGGVVIFTTQPVAIDPSWLRD